MNENFYAFTLTDYSTPGFVSSTKNYYGTIDDMGHLIAYASKEKDCDLLEPFEKLKDGKNVKYHAGQIETQFAKSVNFLAKRNISCGQFQFNHENIWGFPYVINIEKLNAELIVLQEENKYIIAYKACLKNPTVIENDLPPLKLNCGFWGYPHMITVNNSGDGFNLSNTLYLFESVYTDKDTAITAFNNIESINLKSFFDDVFGDG